MTKPVVVVLHCTYTHTFLVNCPGNNTVILYSNKNTILFHSTINKRTRVTFPYLFSQKYKSPSIRDQLAVRTQTLYNLIEYYQKARIIRFLFVGHIKFCAIHAQNYSGLQPVLHIISEVSLKPPTVFLQTGRAVLMNSMIHDKCGHMVEPAGQARGAS